MISPTLIVPPALGAFIGYMTNYVAIKMLLRPLRPWRLFGIRIPMTPGVIPAKRHELARNIGDMVGDHLLTSGDIGRAIASQTFQDELGQLINRRLESVLNKDLGPVIDIIPSGFNSYFLATVKVLRWRFIEQMHTYLAGDEFAATLQSTLNDKVDELLTAPLADSLPPEGLNHFSTFLEKSLTDLFAKPEVASWLKEMLDDKLAEMVSSGKSPADLLPADVVDSICSRLEQEAPAILDKLAGLIREPELQENIAQAICTAVANFTAGLGPIAAMISGFISPDVIHNKVTSFLAEKGDEISKWLANDTIQMRVSSIISDKTRSLLNTPLQQMLEGVEDDQLNRLKGELIDQIIIILQNPNTAGQLSSILQEAITSQQDRPLQEILTEVAGADSITKGKDILAAKVLATLRSQRIKAMLDELVVEHVEKKLLNHPIGRLADLLPRDVQDSIGVYGREQISGVLSREVPGLVDSLNITELVTRKVDSLNLLKLEGLLMSIMEEQFKYINLFGALLGFLIGCLNLLVLGW